MEFFNKKQDVIDIQLTAYGKQLLSRGLFKPAFYAFSDDGVLYDSKFMTGSIPAEQQSEIEQRIQEQTPRIKTQGRKVGAERAIFYPRSPTYVFNDYVKTNIENQFEILGDLFEPKSAIEYLELFEKVKIQESFAESEKLLTDFLGTKSFYNSLYPAWNLLFYNGTISSTTTYYKKNDVTVLIPQLNCTLTDTFYKISSNFIGDIPEVKNIFSTFEKTTGFDTDTTLEEESDSIDDLYFEDLTEFVNEGQPFEGTTLTIKDFLFISTEEANVEFTKGNFFVEVFEVTEKTNDDDGEEELTKMFFFDDSPDYKQNALYNGSVETVFNISVDEEINQAIACALIGKDKTLKDQNIYTTNIFDCNEIPEGKGVNNDPYGILPDVDVGDVC